MPASPRSSSTRSRATSSSSTCSGTTRSPPRVDTREIEQVGRSLVSRSTCSRIVARNSARVSSSSSSSVISSRNPPREKSGVRSSCEALAMNSLRATSSWASWTRIASKPRASSPSSSLPGSTTGSSKRPPAIRSAAPLQTADPAGVHRGGAVAEHQRDDQRDRRRRQDPPLDDRNGRLLVLERGRGEKRSAPRPRVGTRPRRSSVRFASPSRSSSPASRRRRAATSSSSTSRESRMSRIGPGRPASAAPGSRPCRSPPRAPQQVRRVVRVAHSPEARQLPGVLVA